MRHICLIENHFINFVKKVKGVQKPFKRRVTEKR